jgi:hypothetical protein
VKLLADNIEDYLRQFNELLLSEDATEKKGIAYVWKMEIPIKRVIGESPIIYIGQTANTLSGRYNNSKSINIEKKYFERYYRYMMELYGHITIDVIETSNPKKSEWEMLMKYNESHKEYPPLNRSIPNEPK